MEGVKKNWYLKKNIYIYKRKKKWQGTRSFFYDI